MAREFDHILLIGFGGPQAPGEIQPFLEAVAKGRRIPEQRLREVAHHYKMIGGHSPYNACVFRLMEQLKEPLCRQAIALPIFVGMRNWHPFLKDALGAIQSKGFKKGIGIILAAHRSEASYGRYVEAMEEAKRGLGAENYECTYLKPWHDHPLFIEAQADQARRTLERAAHEKKSRCHLLFTAHSIPVEMAKQSRYAEEFRRSCELVARELDHPDWSLAYQSRSGNPGQPWLEPDVCAVIRGLKIKGCDAAVVVPLGFPCGNAEILYDLDVEAKQETEMSGIRYFRAPTVTDHPKFAEMLAGMVRDELR